MVYKNKFNLVNFLMNVFKNLLIKKNNIKLRIFLMIQKKPIYNKLINKKYIFKLI